ncbi:MAG: serine/threonine-protein kinase [Kofleriaceae bacterium]
MSFGRYRVDTVLARGGMGEVFLGRIDGEHGFERPIVIKVIRNDLVTDERVAMMFVDEARIAASLHHRNIVQIVDFDRFDGGVFLVTEHVDGCDLRHLLRELRSPPPLSLAVSIIAELATGLHAAHEAVGSDGQSLQLVHRDISPSNVLLGVHGEVKLADFGVAKARTRSYHTVSGTIKGKAPYMSPEQILGGQLDRRSDIFSVGTLMFEIVTRTRLFSGASNAKAMQMILAGEVPEPASRRADIPPALSAIIKRTLAFDRDERYATAAELVEDIDGIARAQRWSLSLAQIAHAVRVTKTRMQGRPPSATPAGGTA